MPIKYKNDVDDDIETVINMTNRNGKKVENKYKRVTQKENRKKQKRKKRIKKIIKWTSLVILTVSALTFALTSPMFNIKEIEVINNNILSKEKIISLSGLNKDENIFRFLKSDIQKFIKEEPYIQNVEINRQLPNTVIIDVEERKRDFSIKFLNGNAYINNQGYILEIAENDLKLPVIKRNRNTRRRNTARKKIK